MPLFPQTKSANILLERMKYDLHKCSHYIQDPKKLKENLIKLHRRYIYEADVTISPADEITRYYHRQIDHFEKVQKTQKETHTRNMKLENNRASRIATESYFLTEQLMDERLKHLHLLNDCKEENIQSAGTPKRQYKPVIKPQCPAHQRGLLEKRRGQTFALEKEGQFAPQKLTSSVKLPPIHPR
ncbi:hypothetical protein QTP70_015909 [Hemibagrus guttatus]|uniref:Uncharacterized protein n=1 Tax=Hemibagrus guttatus TaxID=175788 RepID=A0AAE0PRJ1_9TELE|nr:hypothetical protein QTP70_015909 [Hemibagrus guttatus]